MGSGMAACFGSPLFALILSVAFVMGVQGRSDPKDGSPINRGFFRKPATHVKSQLINFDDSRFWPASAAATRNGQDGDGFVQPRGTVSANVDYGNYAADQEQLYTSKPADGFFSPEQLARIEAFNEAQKAAKGQSYPEARSAKTSTTTSPLGASSQHPIQVFPDRTAPVGEGAGRNVAGGDGATASLIGSDGAR